MNIKKVLIMIMLSSGMMITGCFGSPQTKTSTSSSNNNQQVESSQESSQEQESSKIRFEKSSDGKAYVVYAESTSITGEVVIPDTYEELPVRQVGEEGFKDCVNITSLTIGDNVSKIGDYAFSGCTKLDTIIFGKEVSNYGRGSFSGCTSLFSVKLNEEKGSTIGEYAFSGCTGLRYMNTGGIYTIGNHAFDGCVNLVQMTLGRNAYEANPNGKIGGNKLVEIIANQYSRLGEQLTKGSAGNQEIARNAFQIINNAEDSKLSQTDDKFIVYEGDSSYIVDYFGENKSITLPSKDYVFQYAFAKSDLTSVVINDDIQSLGTGCFEQCPDLTSVTIGKGVKTIGENTFADDGNLSSLIYTGTTAEWAAISTKAGWKEGIAATSVQCSDGTVSI